MVNGLKPGREQYKSITRKEVERDVTCRRFKACKEIYAKMGGLQTKVTNHFSPTSKFRGKHNGFISSDPSAHGLVQFFTYNSYHTYSGIGLSD